MRSEEQEIWEHEKERADDEDGKCRKQEMVKEGRKLIRGEDETR